MELEGKTLGILGCGAIGRRLGEIAGALGMEVLGYSRRAAPGTREGNITIVGREELLERSRFLSLHCPLNDSTRGMINADRLRLMKPTALLLNAARGPVVVARDLADALDKGIIAGAGVDVFDKEPPLDDSEPLLHCKNCLVTPHVAFATRESMTLRAEIVFDNLAAWLAGHQKNVIL